MQSKLRVNVVRPGHLFGWLALLFALAGCVAPVLPPQPATPQPATPQPATPQPGPLQSQIASQRVGSIVVVGNGDMRVQANIAQLDVGVDVVADTVMAAHRVARESIRQILETLAALDVGEGDIQPYAFNVYAERYYPDYEADDPGTVPLFPDSNEAVRYHVIHQIRVTIRDLERVPAVVEAVVEAGGNHLTIYGTNYLYDEPESLEVAARQKAVADAQRKAEEIAQQSGVVLGPVVSISEVIQGGSGWSSYPPLWPGQLHFTKQLQIEYAIAGGAADAPAAVSAASATTALTTSEVVTRDVATSASVSATVSATGVAMQGSTVTVHGGDEAMLRDFLRQFFVETFTPVQATQTDVYIGSLAPNLPFALEVPRTMTVTGSIVTGGEYANSHILFTVEGDVQEHIVALRGQLEEQGYTQTAVQASPEVFVTAAPDYVPLCSADGEWAVTISGRNLTAERGVLRFYLNAVAAFGHPCGQDIGAQPQPDIYAELLPTLVAPVPISVFGSGGGGGGDSYETTIRFAAETTVAELFAAYNAQMAEQGWEQLASTAGDEMAWSGWRLRADPTFTISLYIVGNPDQPGRFQSALRLDKAP